MSAAAVWDALGDVKGEAIADRLRAMVVRRYADAPRSRQRAIGPSEIGDPCTYCLASKILGVYEEGEFSDPWCAITGTATHKWLENAADNDNRKYGGTWSTEVRVMPDPELLPRGGSCDVYDDSTATVIDHKLVGVPRLRSFKANGPGVTYRRQIHLYGLGIENADLPVETVAIAFWPRGGRLADLHVWTEPYQRHIATEALDRYRTLQGLCETAGVAVLRSLPQDPGCYTCGRSNKAQQKPA